MKTLSESSLTRAKGWKQGQEVMLIAVQPLKPASAVAVKPSWSQQHTLPRSAAALLPERKQPSLLCLSLQVAYHWGPLFIASVDHKDTFENTG